MENFKNKEICSGVHCSAKILARGSYPCTPRMSQGSMIVGHTLQRATGANVSLQNEEMMVREANFHSLQEMQQR